MKALILNSGMGTRMGVMTSSQPKCMTEVSGQETIISRQLKSLIDLGIEEAVITTGYHSDTLSEYIENLDLSIKVKFVKNKLYDKTNYIYSIYEARKYLDDDILLMHGDLVYENKVIDLVMEHNGSCMVISSSAALPEKDFKAVIDKATNKIIKVSTKVFDNAVAAQPLYKLTKADWRVWLNNIVKFCENGETSCYAEDALNEVSNLCSIAPIDIYNDLCAEIDTPDDLKTVSSKLKAISNRTVYMCFSTDVLHSGHIAIMKKAARLGKLTIGVLSDKAIAGFKRFPLIPFEERKSLFQNLAFVNKVVTQTELSYKKNILQYKPDYVVHGDDWQQGIQKPIRDEVMELLSAYGGKLVDFPYSYNEQLKKIDDRVRAELFLPDMRRSRLKKLLEIKGLVTAIEAHSGLTGLIAEKTVVYKNGEAHQFDAMWVSSLCDSTAKGKPDIELVDMTSRFRTIDDIMEVTTKPIIFDGDTGGLIEHFVHTVRTLERIGVSMVIIEDKTGLKKNSLFGNEVAQTQDSIEHFCEKIKAGNRAKKTADFMICARIESLILERGMADALKRATAYVRAGADAIMIHSRKKDPSEIFEFVASFRAKDKNTPIVVVPTSFNTVTEEEFYANGVNVVIYANQLTRSGFPAMQNAAKSILTHHRAKECDEVCMPIKDIITLIPEED